jgi:Lipase (class 3)
MEAVETLKRISGIDRMFSLSLHELTACIYYKLAIDRGLRGCDPEGERVAHTVKPKARSGSGAVSAGDIAEEKRPYGGFESQNSEEADDDDPSACEEVEEEELDDIIRFAPLALSAVYEESSADVQRLALAQGWATIFISSQSAPEQPAYALFASATERGKRDGERKEVVLAVRGTASVEDIVTDIRAAPQQFPPEEEDISKALFPTPSLFHYSRKTALSPDVNQGREDRAQRDNDGWLMISNDTDLELEGEEKEESYACGGMARAALWLLGQVGPALLQLHVEGYEVIIVGHSMGGSVAALLCHLMRTHLSSAPAPDSTSPHQGKRREPPRSLGFRCITYGCPSSMCIRLARSMTPYVTSVVLHDDIVSRITPQSIR